MRLKDAVELVFDEIDLSIQDRAEIMEMLTEDGLEFAQLLAGMLKKNIEGERYQKDLCPDCYSETQAMFTAARMDSMDPPQPIARYCKGGCGWAEKL